MTYPLSEIEGLTAYSASKLKSLGIRTTEALLEAARTVKGRKSIAAKTGISEQQLLEWANFSDYMRIPGMGKAKVGLVRAAGVTTVRELALRNPARLAQNMKDVNTKRKLVRVLPSERSVEQLIEPVLNPIWVALFVGERPSGATVIGGGLILAALALRYAVWGDRERLPASPD